MSLSNYFSARKSNQIQSHQGSKSKLGKKYAMMCRLCGKGQSVLIFIYFTYILLCEIGYVTPKLVALSMSTSLARGVP
jgi:hypothetical protein